MPFPDHKTLSVSAEMLLALIQCLLFYYWQNLLSTLKELLKAIQVKSFSQRAIWTKQVELVLSLVGSTDDHAIAIEPSKWSGLQVGEDNNFPFHFLDGYVFLQT